MCVFGIVCVCEESDQFETFGEVGGDEHDLIGGSSYNHLKLVDEVVRLSCNLPIPHLLSH